MKIIKRVEDGSPRHAYVMCECACGTRKVVRRDHVLSGRVVSCGCAKKKPLTHGDAGRKAPEYRSWKSMKARCLNPKHKAFDRYGGAGIGIYPGWIESYESFLSHVGRRPSPEMSLDRIDNRRGYVPGNVRWATAKQQSENRNCVRRVAWKGETHSISEWGRRLNLSSDAIRGRLNRGWTVERAMTTPLTKGAK